MIVPPFPAFAFTTGIVWRSPFTSYGLLDLLPGGNYSQPRQCTSNGQTMVGLATDPSNTRRPTQWDATTLALTQPAGVTSPATNGQEVFCSQDGSILVGCEGDGLYMVRWTGGGSAGALLPFSGYDHSIFNGVPVEGGLAPKATFRSSSDSGAAIAGSVQPASGLQQAARWDGGALTVLPPPFGVGGGNGGTGNCCSSDGTVVLGMSPAGTGCFWIGTTYYALCHTDGASTLHTQVTFCNADGSVIWGNSDDNSSPSGGAPYYGQRTCYWTNVTTPHSSGDPFNTGKYGVVHYVDDFPSTTRIYETTIEWVAESTTSPLAVGWGQTDQGTKAGKWNGTTLTVLPWLPPPSGGLPDTWALGCSGDWSTVCGNSNNLPVYWDAGNAIHQLPFPTGPAGSTSSAQTIGISRDGSTIFGTYSYTPPSSSGPPPPSPLALDNVVAFTQAGVDSQLVFLDWSNDRGHSYGNAVGHPIGARGEYHTNVQWQRLGYARDRVWRLTWSVPVATALQGAFIDAEPAKS